MDRRKKVEGMKYDPRIENEVRPIGNLPNCYIFDLDGTISLMEGRSAYDGKSYDNDTPNTPVIKILRTLYEHTDAKIFLFSGRNGDSAEETVEWLKLHNVPFHVLEMRKEKDYRKDTVVKQEMYEAYVLGKYNVLGVFDDRDMMIKHWRDVLNLPTFQVYWGDF